MSTPNYNSLPRSFRLHRHEPFTVDPDVEPIPLRKSSLTSTVPTQLQISDARTKSPSVTSNSSDDTFVNRDADHSPTLKRLATKSRTPVNRAFLYDSDDSSSSQEPSARITALPDLPPDLDALSRHDLERLTRLLFADSCRARWVAMSEQEKIKELERKLDKMSAESIRRQRQLLEAVEKQGRELERAKEDAAGLRKRLGQVMSILSTVIPGLAPRTRDC